MKAIITYFSLALLLSASIINCMKTGNQLSLQKANGDEDEVSRLMKLHDNIRDELFPPSSEANQNSDETQEEAALLVQKQEIIRKTNAELQESSNSTFAFLKEMEKEKAEQKRRDKLFEPFEQIKALIGQFQEFQENERLNIPENKPISHGMISNMQTLLDKAKANYGLPATAQSSSTRPALWRHDDDPGN